jgi:hypothetical protein
VSAKIPICVVCKEEGEAHHKHQSTTIRTAVVEVRASIEAHITAASALCKEAESASQVLVSKVAQAQKSAMEGAAHIRVQFEAARKVLALREAQLSKEHETLCRVRRFCVLCCLFLYKHLDLLCSVLRSASSVLGVSCG